MNRAIFFDRDGIINERILDSYVSKIEDFKFIDDIFEILKYVKSRGYLAIIITNQQGIGKGLMSEEDLFVVHDFMQNKLYESTGERFDAIFYCPETAESNSTRRKPNPGMIFEAIEIFDIDTNQSLMIGDSVSDAEAALNAGMKCILIGNHDFVHPNVNCLPDMSELLININSIIT